MKLDNRAIGLLVWLAVMVVGALGSIDGDGTGSPRDTEPPEISVRRPPIVGQPLPAASDADPIFNVELGAKRDSSGTAFALGDGLWMTARHVIAGCDRTGLLTGPRQARRASAIAVHPGADLAIMRVPVTAPSVRVSDSALRLGQDGYHFGYPRGEPGAVRSQLMGRRVMRLSGRYRTAEPVIAWAEIERIPDRNTPLSGISGGPVFNAKGELIGVHVAGSVRRGRSYTAAPVTIRELLDRAGVSPARDAVSPALSPESFAAAGNRLRRTGTVSKAICVVR